MEDRAATYDKPEGERSMGSTVLAFAAITGVLMTEEQGWLFMALLKAVRSQQGAYRADSYEDGAAYFALAGEAAVRDRNGGWTDKAIKADALPESFGQQNQLDTGAMRFETVRDWVKWAWNGSFIPGNPREEAISAVKRSNGRLIICELGFQAGPFKDGGFTGKGCLNASPVGGPMLRCHDCIAENCACIAS